MLGKLTLLAIVAGATVYGIGKWLTKPAIDVNTFVETPELRERMDKKWANVVNGPRGTPLVNIEAPESVIRWPAYKSQTVSAPALELRIRKELWAKDQPVQDIGYIGPLGISLKLEWPEPEETRQKAPASEREMTVSYGRGFDLETRDPLYDPAIRARPGVVHMTEPDSPREKAYLVYCSTYKKFDCDLHFEHLGRPAHISLPQRRIEDWESGMNAAKRLLSVVATPITPR